MDWTKATPNEVEIEVRKRIGITIESELFVDVFDDRGQFRQDRFVRDVYTNNIAAVLRDVLPKMKRDDATIEASFYGDGGGEICNRTNLYDDCVHISSWDSIDAAPLAICREFCAMKEPTP